MYGGFDRMAWNFCHSPCLFGNIDRRRLRILRELQHRQADGARPRPDIRELQHGLSLLWLSLASSLCLHACQLFQPFHGSLDEDLRIRARHERILRHPERQPHELFLAKDIRHGHMRHALLHHIMEPRQLRFLQRLRQKDFRIQPRRFHAMLCEKILRPLQDTANRPNFLCCHFVTCF